MHTAQSHTETHTHAVHKADSGDILQPLQLSCLSLRAVAPLDCGVRLV